MIVSSVVVVVVVVVIVMVVVVVVFVVVVVVVVVVMFAVPSYESDGERDDEPAHSVANYETCAYQISDLLRTAFLDPFWETGIQ